MFRSSAHRLVLLWGWRRYGAAAIAGALSALAMAPVHLAPILFLTLPALVFLIDGSATVGRHGLSRLRPAAAVGWWFGFGYFLAGLHWIGAAFFAEGPELVPLMPFAVAGLAAGLALFTAAGTAFARLFWSESPLRLLALAVGLSLSEWLRGHLFTGFPWNLYGEAVGFTDVTAQAASVVGVYGLTVFGLYVFAAPAALATEPGRFRLTTRLTLALALVLVVADIGYGLVRLGAAAAVGTSVVDDARIRIVQPNINQGQKWSNDFRQATITKLIELSDAKTGPDAMGAMSFNQIIWPETALPFFLTEEPSALEAIAELLPPGTSLVAGAPRLEPTDTGRRFYNSVFVIDDAGGIVAAYDKIHLVPFGEYMPMQGLLDRLGVGQLFKGIGGFSAGPRREIVHVPHLPSFSILVCYEAIFPGEVVDEAGERPGYLINVTNDGWFGRTSGPYQHLDEVRLRAIEEGLPIVRAANTGISAIIDGYGRVVSQLPLGIDGVLDGKVPKERPPSLFSRIGRIVFWAVHVFAIILLVAARRKLSSRS